MRTGIFAAAIAALAITMFGSSGVDAQTPAPGGPLKSHISGAPTIHDRTHF